MTHTTARYGQTIAMLSGAVALIVLIACVNVAGLLLARGATRQPELAIRKSIGASRGRLVRQLLAESAVLALAGGVAGVILAFLTLDAIVGLIPLRLPAQRDTGGQSAGPGVRARRCRCVTSIAFGLAPALKLSRASVNAHRSRRSHAPRLRADAARRASADRGRGGDGTGARHRRRADDSKLLEDPGDRRRLRARRDRHDGSGAGRDQSGSQEAYYVTLLQQRAPDPWHCRRRRRQTVRRWTAAVHTRARPPMAARQASPAERLRRDTSKRLVCRSRQGRFPTDADYSAGPPFAVLSESAARAIFPDQPAVGQQFVLGNKSWTVVGVVGDARNRSPLPRTGTARSRISRIEPDASSAFGAAADGRGPPGGPDSSTRGAASSRGTGRRSHR